MSSRNYMACRKPVNQDHGIVSKLFLDELIDSIDPLPDAVFEKNDQHDIYSVMLGALGPYTDLVHRKAVMCEVLRVMAAFESDWNWKAGVDVGNEYSKHHKEGEETGAFQVSWDSLVFDKSLKDCLDRLAGAHDVITFITQMKSNHALAVEYCARLLRFNTTWCGTLNHAAMVMAHVRRDAVEEFKSFLTSNTKTTLTVNAANTENGDALQIAALINNATDSNTFKNMQKRAATKLFKYDGEIYPHDGCAITLSLMLQDAGIAVPDTYMAIELTNLLRDKRTWQKIAPGQQQPGDVGTTCGKTARHGLDHIYVVLKKLNDDEMLIADNQSAEPHFRWASGQGGKTPTKYFLRAI